MRSHGKRYTEDFKKMIIEVYNTGKPVKEICEEYGVTHASIGKWVNKVQPREKVAEKPVVKVKKEATEHSDEDKKEISRLKKENERIAMENEILKKAIAIFSKNQNL